MTIIGITGYARNGKDTAGRVLVEEYGFTRIALADAVRDVAVAIDPYVTQNAGPGEDWRLSKVIEEGRRRGHENPWDYAKTFPEVRRLLQAVGTEGGRDVLGEDIWINALREKIRKSDVADVVVTDVRFPNEADMINDLLGEIWRVSRVNEDESFFDNGLGTDHSSEKFISSIDYDCLITAKSVEDVAVGVRRLME